MSLCIKGLSQYPWVSKHCLSSICIVDEINFSENSSVSVPLFRSPTSVLYSNWSRCNLVCVKVKKSHQWSITGPYNLSCKQKICKQFDICPIILWYLGYLKQERTKKFNDPFFREDRLTLFLYKTSCDRKPRITKWSVWKSSWRKKSH